MSIHRFHFPTAIRFGPGAVGLAPDGLREKGCSRPLVVTDRGLATIEFVTRLFTDLKKQGLIPALYSGVYGNPVESQVTAGVEAFHGHGADSLVIVGGGAALDVGKAIALMVNHPGRLFDYEDGKPDARPVDQPIPFMIAIPTTAGTGSEVGRSAVVSDDVTKAKKIIFDPRLLPQLVLADPELTLGLPKAMTAQTGFDALTHNIEAYLATGFHPICDGIALEGVRLCAMHLRDAVENPTDLTARSGMLMASMMGAIAFQKGLGVTHSCAHALSTVHDLHHGLANALMLPACLAFNSAVVASRMARLASTVGLAYKTSDEGAARFVTWVRELREKVGIPGSLASLGLEISDALIAAAVADGCHQSNPRSVSADDFRKLFAEAM